MMVEKGMPVLQGDSEDEETLKKANIEVARGLITTMRDSQNLVTIIAAKTMNPNLHIVSEDEEVENIAKLKRHEMGAKIMVNTARHATIDPLCGVEVSSIKTQCSIEHDGRNLAFCSKECLEAFKMYPNRFLATIQDDRCRPP
jgi:YHS domain-containing protein